MCPYYPVIKLPRRVASDVPGKKIFLESEGIVLLLSTLWHYFLLFFRLISVSLSSLFLCIPILSFHHFVSFQLLSLFYSLWAYHLFLVTFACYVSSYSYNRKRTNGAKTQDRKDFHPIPSKVFPPFPIILINW